MLDLDVIEQTIKELEDSDTTFFNCQNLASLYIVRDKLTQSKLDKELYDVIPAYKKYCAAKKKYQLQELSEQAVIEELKKVCKEITEFITRLYENTDMKSERGIILNMIYLLSISYPLDAD